MEIYVIKGYNIILTGNTKILVGNTEETKDKGVTATLKLLNKTAYNGLIIKQ